ncbi:maleylacetoacetate isomerase [Porphyrobacter sp. GA68]|uniref:maleylacetoacetate isomerase n=1 Tax=Porphyrobacter sp. GA68 TaxID=2883480 RepID=UPI001D1928C7|nr:maleylacetoacetate isomerase [Porphyrobacter sp. GA68]
MRLYGYWRSSTSYRLRIALNLKQLAFENVPVDLLTAANRGADFTARNPFGSVPLLEAGDERFVQSMAIIEWLEEAYPEMPLLPDDVRQRYVARELAYAIATELHAPLNLPVLRYLKSEFGRTQDEIDTYYRHILARTLIPVERRLEELGTGDFLFDKPGLFETVLIPQLYNARRFAFDLSGHPRTVRIEAACLALPAFQAAHPDQQPDNPETTP